CQEYLTRHNLTSFPTRRSSDLRVLDLGGLRRANLPGLAVSLLQRTLGVSDAACGIFLRPSRLLLSPSQLLLGTPNVLGPVATGALQVRLRLTHTASGLLHPPPGRHHLIVASDPHLGSVRGLLAHVADPLPDLRQALLCLPVSQLGFLLLHRRGPGLRDQLPGFLYRQLRFLDLQQLLGTLGANVVDLLLRLGQVELELLKADSRHTRTGRLLECSLSLLNLQFRLLHLQNGGRPLALDLLQP